MEIFLHKNSIKYFFFSFYFKKKKVFLTKQKENLNVYIYVCFGGLILGIMNTWCLKRKRAEENLWENQNDLAMLVTSVVEVKPL